MIDIKLIRENPELIKRNCQKRGVEVDVDKILELDKTKRELLKEVEQLRKQTNEIAKALPKEKNPSKKQNLIKKGKEIKQKQKEKEKLLKKVDSDLQSLIKLLPNLLQPDVPEGKDERDNIVVKEWGGKPKFDFPPRDYLEIAQKLDLIDMKRASKISGTRFGIIKRELVIMEFALINFVLETLMKENFIPVIPPVMIKPEMMEGMGFLERGKDEIYFIEKDNLYLVGTSEQSIGPMHKDEIFSEKELPKRYIGFSTCFRREAGSYGKDTKGILRVHQFDKLEMFSFSHPKDSVKEHEFLLKMEEKLMQSLKIPYRVVKLCSGDLGDSSSKTYDIEAWMPGQNQYRETHSTSNCTDFQARRLNIRYRDSKTGKLNFVHTLNGTAFAIGRILIAIIENYQRKDGTIEVPKVLQKYTKFKKIR